MREENFMVDGGWCCVGFGNPFGVQLPQKELEMKFGRMLNEILKE